MVLRANVSSRCCATAPRPCSMSSGAIGFRPSRSRPAGSSRCIRRGASRSRSGGCGNGRNSARRSSCSPATRPARCWDRRPGSAASGTRPEDTSIRWRCRGGWRAWCWIWAAASTRARPRSPSSAQRPLGRQDGKGRDQRPGAGSWRPTPIPANSRIPLRLISRTKSCRSCHGKWRRSLCPTRPARPSFPAGRRCPIPTASSTSRATMRAIDWSPAAP